MTLLMVKATVVLVIALVSTRFARRSRATVRHAILVAAFATLMALPVLSVLSPAVNLPLPVHAMPSFGEGIFPPPKPSATAGAAALRQAAAPSVDWILRGISTGLAAGALIAFLPVLAGAGQVRRLRRGGIPFDAAERAALALAEQLGLRLEQANVSRQVLVIESIEPASEN